MLVFQAYRFELDPSDKTRSALASHAGAARVAHNVMLAYVRYCLERRGWERRVLGEATTPLPWGLAALRREWNQIKPWAAPWWAENSKEAYNSGLEGLARSLDAWSKSRRGERGGPRVGFPKMHAKDHRRSFRVTTGSFGLVDDRHVRLPRIGVVRSKEPVTALARRLNAGTARVLSATVSERAGRWFVAFCVETQRQDLPVPAGLAVGVDVGVKHLAVLSTGEQVPNPKHLSKWRRRQARLQRQCSRRAGPDRRRRQNPSKRWLASKRRLARTHRRAADARVDGLHKLTTRLAKTHRTVVVEDLNVAGMTATAKGSGHWRPKAALNRAVLDVAPSELRRQLGYKCRWYGSTLVVAERWYPSSKTCSGCGTVKAKLALSQRLFRCATCGLVIDRDLNAAANLANLVEATTNPGTASGAGTDQHALVNGQGEEKFMPQGRCSSTNCQDGTEHPSDKTATAAEQSTAA